jgi:hypothetical protein
MEVGSRPVATPRRTPRDTASVMPSSLKTAPEMAMVRLSGPPPALAGSWAGRALAARSLPPGAFVEGDAVGGLGF